MTTGRINQVNGGTSGNEPSIFGVSHRERTTAREPSPLRARQVRMKELPLHSHRGLRGSASHPRPTDKVRLEPKSHHAVREREESENTPFITLGRSTRGGCREATTRGMILDLHHRHSAEGSTEVQGNAPLLSVTHGEKGTPESSYPLSHIRQDERAGRDSQEAFAQGASKKGGGRFPRDDNRGATRLVPASNPRRSDSGSHPSRSSSRRKIPRDDNRGATRQVPASNPGRSDSGSHPSHSSSRRRTAHPSPGRKIPHGDNREVTRAGPFAPIQREIGFRVPPFPSRHQPREKSTHRRAERSPTATTAKLQEQVPSCQSRKRSDSGSRPSPPVISRERATRHRQNCQIHLGRIRARRLQPVHTLSHALGRE